MNIDNGEIEHGRIKWYSIGKQFGFITRKDGQDFFLHHSAIIFDSGFCDHQRGICARALGLLEQPIDARKFTTKQIETMLREQEVTFRVFIGQRSPEARGVRSAKR